MPEQQLIAERVRYIGVSEVPLYYLLCRNDDETWEAAALDDYDHVIHRFGPFRRRGEAINAAEHYLDHPAARVADARGLFLDA